MDSLGSQQTRTALAAGCCGLIVGVALRELIARARSGGPPGASVDDASAPPAIEYVQVEQAKLRAFVAAIFRCCKIPESEASEAADILLLADLRGIDSHGVARLFAYHKMLVAGLIEPGEWISAQIWP